MVDTRTITQKIKDTNGKRFTLREAQEFERSLHKSPTELISYRWVVSYRWVDRKTVSIINFNL